MTPDASTFPLPYPTLLNPNGATMRPKTLVYTIGDELECEINVAEKTIYFSRSHLPPAEGFTFSLTEFNQIIQLATVLSQSRISLSETIPQPTPYTGTGATTAPKKPYLPEDSKKAHTSTFIASLEDKDLTVKDMYVVRKDGLFYSTPPQPGQITPPSEPIEKARLFPTAEEAHAVQQAFPGSDICVFHTVGNYQICFAYPDGSVKFWAGQGDPVTHVNLAGTIGGRDAALQQLKAIQVPSGARAFLYPKLA